MLLSHFEGSAELMVESCRVRSDGMRIGGISNRNFGAGLKSEECAEHSIECRSAWIDGVYRTYQVSSESACMKICQKALFTAQIGCWHEHAI